jgi:hypothetical protein
MRPFAGRLAKLRVNRFLEGRKGILLFATWRVVPLIALIALYSGCYHYHLRANGDKLNSSSFRKTLGPSDRARGSEFVVPPGQSAGPGSSAAPADCTFNGLYEVGITSSWGDAAGKVFSFGHWSRVKVDWLCAKEPPVMGPRGLPASPGRSAAPGVAGQQSRSKPGPDGFTRRTVHSFLWGALQQNLLPPPNAALKTPANCKSMRQVRLPMNYGYALITVFSAGIWSPQRVAWQCVEDSNGALLSTADSPPAALRPFSHLMSAPAN